MTSSELRKRRVRAGLSGSLVCARAGIVRSRLSLIENGFVVPPREELARIDAALTELIHARQELTTVAGRLGVGVSLTAAGA